MGDNVEGLPKIVALQELAPIKGLRYVGDNLEQFTNFMAGRGFELLTVCDRSKRVVYRCTNCPFIDIKVDVGSWVIHKQGSFAESVFDEYISDGYKVLGEVE